MIERSLVTDAFDRYAAAYNASDPKIRLKIAHTYRVAALCERIAAEIGADDPDLAWLCGMLHDIGRFEQVARYGTFIDAESVDHAALGADLLFREGLASAFALERLPEASRQILETAIRSHNAYRLDPGLPEETRIHCDILRDADKIDISRANCETPLEDIYNVSTEVLRASAVSEAVRDCFRGRATVLRTLKRTPADYLVAQICLVFGLVYPVSRQIVREQGYVDRLLSFRSDNPETQSWFEYMRETIWDVPGQGPGPH